MNDNPYASPAGQPELKLWPTLGKAVELVLDAITAPAALALVVMLWPAITFVCFCLEWRDSGGPSAISEATEFVLDTWWVFVLSVAAWAVAFYFGGTIR